MAVRQVGNLSKYIKELRIHLCQKSQSSQGVRKFIESRYVPIKKQNMRFPILIRECSNIEPKVYARFDFGVEKSAALSNLSAKDVEETIATLVYESESSKR